MKNLYIHLNSEILNFYTCFETLRDGDLNICELFRYQYYFKSTHKIKNATTVRPCFRPTNEQQTDCHAQIKEIHLQNYCNSPVRLLKFMFITIKIHPQNYDNSSL